MLPGGAPDGAATDDVRRRMVDVDLQGYFTSHHPVPVPESFTPEPSESWTRADLDEYAAVVAQIPREAHEEPELVTSPPDNAPSTGATRRPSTSPSAGQ